MAGVADFAPVVRADTDRDRLRGQLTLPRFPRSTAYDPAWLVDGCMGPNPVWLLEWLAERMDLRPGMRVLDLGCGRALTSVFLAREFSVSVVAADLWIRPDENWPGIVAAGCESSVLPIHAEAHDLKFAAEYFDAVVSIDAYQYFGTNDLYIGYLTNFLKADGQLGIVVPGLVAELDEVPTELEPYWEWDFACFHSAQWWRRHWERTGKVAVEVADDDPDGWLHWSAWADACAMASENDWIREMSARSAEMNRIDSGRTLTFCRVVARRT
jgi:SAM-dependent methyltransferase